MYYFSLTWGSFLFSLFQTTDFSLQISRHTPLFSVLHLYSLPPSSWQMFLFSSWFCLSVSAGVWQSTPSVSLGNTKTSFRPAIWVMCIVHSSSPIGLISQVHKVLRNIICFLMIPNQFMVWILWFKTGSRSRWIQLTWHGSDDITHNAVWFL